MATGIYAEGGLGRFDLLPGDIQLHIWQFAREIFAVNRIAAMWRGFRARLLRGSDESVIIEGMRRLSKAFPFLPHPRDRRNRNLLMQIARGERRRAARRGEVWTTQYTRANR